MNNNTFAERLNKALSDSIYNASQLSKLTGISKSSISEYLSGKFTPKYQNTQKIAKILGVSTEWLSGTSNSIKAKSNSFVVYGKIGSYLFNERIKKNYSIKDVSKKANILEKDIIEIENNQLVPSVELLEKFSKLYNCPIFDLLNFIGYFVEDSDNFSYLTVDISKLNENKLIDIIKFIESKK